MTEQGILELQSLIFLLQLLVFGWQAIQLKRTVVEMKDAKGISQLSADAALRAAEASEKAIEQMLVANEVSQRGVRAAELAANAAMGVELPTLHIENIEEQLQPIEEWKERFFPTLTIKNYGRTPAFVTNIILRVKTGHGLPETPDYGNVEEYFKPLVIDSKQTYLHTIYKDNSAYNFSAKELKDIQDKDGWLYLYGYIQYVDFLEVEHKKGFCFLWVPGTKQFIPNRAYPQFAYQT